LLNSITSTCRFVLRKSQSDDAEVEEGNCSASM
jgi:hypothetical protein